MMLTFLIFSLLLSFGTLSYIIGCMVTRKSIINKNQYLEAMNKEIISDLCKISKTKISFAKEISDWEALMRNYGQNTKTNTNFVKIDYLSNCPFKVVVVKVKNNQLMIRTVYKSTGHKFQTSETYKNKPFAIKKAEELASYFGTSVEYEERKT